MRRVWGRAAACARVVIAALFIAAPAGAENGYDLWLRYPQVADAALLQQ